MNNRAHAYVFFALALRRGEWSNFRPIRKCTAKPCRARDQERRVALLSARLTATINGETDQLQDRVRCSVFSQ